MHIIIVITAQSRSNERFITGVARKTSSASLGLHRCAAARRTHERRQRLRSLLRSGMANARLSARYSEEERAEADDAPPPAAAPSPACGFLLAAVAASERARASVRRDDSGISEECDE